LLDENNYVVMASVGLTAGFDLVDLGLLIEHLKQIELQDNVVEIG
jgi:hypothetical protein